MVDDHEEIRRAHERITELEARVDKVTKSTILALQEVKELLEQMLAGNDN